MTRNEKSLQDRSAISNTMVRITSTLLAMSIMVFAPSAYALCTKPAALPAVPHGDVATLAEMKTGRDSVQSTVNLLQQYQTCLSKQIATVPAGENSNQLKLAWAAQGDAAIDAAQHLADQFSAQLRLFKARAKPAKP